MMPEQQKHHVCTREHHEPHKEDISGKCQNEKQSPHDGGSWRYGAVFTDHKWICLACVGISYSEQGDITTERQIEEPEKQENILDVICKCVFEF